MSELPNTRVQRTRSSASPPHSPLTRSRLGAGRFTLALAALSMMASAACLNAPRPSLVATQGDLASLRGVSELAVYADDADMPLLKEELHHLNPGIVFTTADNAQVIIHFQAPRVAQVCVDCGEDWSPGIVRWRWGVATVQRHDDRDHCLPSLLLAEWQWEAYRRKSLVRAFVQSLEPYLRAPGA
jgi:hypothetical protein